MALTQFVNGSISTTSTNGQTSGDTAITPASTVGFPSSAQFTLLERQTGELMLVTALGATWTVTRGYGGTTAAAITAGDNLDYSITREMLLGGFVAKLDETVALAADATSGVMTLTVPSGLTGLIQGLRVVVRSSYRNNGAGNTYLQMRLNNDAGTTKYFTSYAYWGSGSSSGNFSGLTQARIGWHGATQSGGQVTHATHTQIELSGCFDTTLWTYFSIQQHMRDGSGAYYMMQTAGRWEDTTAVSTVKIASDNSSANGTWSGGDLAIASRAYLYGIP